MKIKLLASLATDHTAYKMGDVVDWPDDADAERLIAAGAAQAAAPVAEKPQPQNMTSAKGQNFGTKKG